MFVVIIIKLKNINTQIIKLKIYGYKVHNKIRKYTYI